MGRSRFSTLLWTVVFLWGLCFPNRIPAQVPPPKEVAEVIVEGNVRWQTDQILSQVNTRVGRPYNLTQANDDVAKLLSKGWFQDVKVYTRPTADGKVVVIFHIVELRNVVKEIVYRGAQQLSDKELETLTGLRKGNPNSPMANRMAVQAILRKYQEMGRVFASVRLLEGDKPDDTRVVFDIVEGPVVKISDIEVQFIGEKSGLISEGRVKQQINSSAHFLRIGGEYNPMTVESDVTKIKEYFKAQGFLATRVSREPIWSSDHRNVKIIYSIEEGPRYKVTHVQVDGVKAYEPEKIQSLVDLKEQDTYNKMVVSADLKRIENYYGYGGRPTRVSEEYNEIKPGEVQVRYVVEERDPVHVREVLIRGNEVTKDYVIRRQVPILPGQILSYPDIFRGQENLARTGLFDDEQKPTITVLDSDKGDDFKDILVTVKEKPTGKLMFGAGINSDNGLTGSIVLNESNFDPFRLPTSFEDILEGRAFRGRGEEFRLEAQPGTEVQRYQATWRESSLFDSPYSLALSAYYYTRNYDEYDERRFGGRVTLGRKLDENWSVNASLRIEQVNVNSVPFFAPWEIMQYQGDHFVLGGKLGVSYDTRDSYLRPTTGHLLSASYEQVTGSYGYGIALAEASQYFTTYERVDGSGKQVLALKSQVGFAGSDTPVYDRFYAGGFNSMRGFAFRGVGPYVDGFNVGGDFMFLNSVEYQIPVMASDKVFFVTFLDSGTVESSTEILNYRVTAGAGVRISVPQLFGPVPLALDFGFPIVQKDGDKRQVFSFWLGFYN